MTTETVLPDAPIADAGADGQQLTADQNAEAKPDTEGEAKPDDQPKPQKSAEEKEIARLRRRVDNLTRQKYELQSRATNGSHESAETRDNAQQQAEGGALTLSRRELQELIDKRANELAPKITKQQAEIEHRSASVKGLVKELGADKFQELTDDLAGIFDHGKQLAILETDSPRALLEYLTDPENADEAERIAGMSDFRAGRALAAIESKLKEGAEKSRQKPSKAGAPLEPLRSEAATPTGMPDPSNVKAYIAWANKRDAAARNQR